MSAPKPIKKWLTISGSYGILLDRPLMARLGIEGTTPMGIGTDGQHILIRPIFDLRLRRSPPLHLVKNLVKLGSSYALFVDKGVLAVLGFEPAKKEVEIITDGKSIVLRQVGTEDLTTGLANEEAVEEVLQNALTIDAWNREVA